jgi:hypothetical protein
MLKQKDRAFSSEVDTGSREENASKQKVERFQAKWIPVRVKKTRQNKKVEPRSDSIGMEEALASLPRHPSRIARNDPIQRSRVDRRRDPQF